MGIFDGISNWNKQREKVKQERVIARQIEREKEAQNYIAKEGIRCDSGMDFETMKLIVDSFTDRGDISSSSNISISENYSYMDNDAVQVADANMYQFCKAIISQNFMLMRKIDDLSKRLEAIESKVGK